MKIIQKDGSGEIIYSMEDLIFLGGGGGGLINNKGKDNSEWEDNFN